MNVIEQKTYAGNPPGRRDFPAYLSRSKRALLKNLEHPTLFARGESVCKYAMRVLTENLHRTDARRLVDKTTAPGSRVGPFQFFTCDAPLNLAVGEFPVEESFAYTTELLYICAPADDAPEDDSSTADVVRLAHALFGATRRYATVDDKGKYITWWSSKAPGPVRDDVAVYLDATGKWNEIQKFTADEEEDARAKEPVICERCSVINQRAYIDVILREDPANVNDILLRYTCINCDAPLPHRLRIQP